ncbi:PREDICTED: putative pentatricopeptide repeat-containing protein At3g25970 [Camelina sativa]|uniref:Pentatricopeptide repeat-containing protein At3g25970 n=1 Tax=Camelina sativa TaxID=90675 RepID=A0ABM0TCS3_CAMSA|nr:PREDICTED: putative pentatricopeptide repeat-containing protein At3g25970 [Camelina sativa]
MVLDSYMKFGFLGYAAHKLFDEMPHRDSVSWNTSFGRLEDAWSLFKCMRRSECIVDGYSFSKLLKGIALAKRLDLGEQVHSLVVKGGGYECNVFVGSALVDMYAKVRDIKTAFCLLGSMEMKAAMTMDDVHHAKVLKLGLEHEITICNAMIRSYADYGSVSDVKRVFDGLGGIKDLISWNSMLTGFSKHELKESASGLFIEMQRTLIEADIYTYTGILSACSGEEDQMFGKSLHGLVIKMGLEQVTSVSNALVSMYIQ